MDQIDTHDVLARSSVCRLRSDVDAITTTVMGRADATCEDSSARLLRVGRMQGGPGDRFGHGNNIRQPT
jgi:hypothetical protein